VKISSDEGHEEVSGGIPWRMARKSSFPCRKETRAVYASSKESFGSGLNDMLRRYHSFLPISSKRKTKQKLSGNHNSTS